MTPTNAALLLDLLHLQQMLIAMPRADTICHTDAAIRTLAAHLPPELDDAITALLADYVRFEEAA